MPLADLQQRFAAALMNPAVSPPEEVVGRDRLPPGRRFDVYRNNVVVGLVNALRAAYPALERIVGAEFFAAAARVYVRDHLPERPILIRYGESFPDFLGSFPPAAGRPWLADVARIERARLAAYHAADAPPLAPEGLGAIAPEMLGEARFRPHPAAWILRSRYPIVTIWMMNSGPREPAPVDFGEAQDALVTRPHLGVQVRLLRPGGAAFLQALEAGKALAGAAAAGAADAPHFDLAASLADALAAGAFRQLEDAGP